MRRKVVKSESSSYPADVVRKKMNPGDLFKRMRRMRIVIVLIALLLAYGAVSFSPRAATTLPVVSVGLGGITGTTNNTVLAYGRYILVAPFWPSKGVAENGDLELSELDNSFIYVIDTKKPNGKALSKQLITGDGSGGLGKTVYFPTRVVFDPDSSNVYVRGTRFEEKDGEVTPVDVIAYLRLNLDDVGKPVFGSVVVAIDIQGIGREFTGEAPLDFGFGREGELMVFTNGASVFSYNLDQGYLYEIGIVPESEYSADNDSISFLDVDPATNVVTVCWNRKVVNQDNIASVSSEISFYRLGEKGTFEILKRVYTDQLPEGVGLASGSNVAIVSDSADSEIALFATNDGSLCSVDLRTDGVQAIVKRMYEFPELARASETDTSPLIVQYDSGKRTIGIVKPGFTVQISRPSNGKKGRISRPSNMHINSAPPVLAMARLGKKNKVVSTSSFSEDFEGDGGLSNFVDGQDSQWLISTYSGNLYSVEVASELPDSKLTLRGQVGSRVERIDYYSDRSSVVAINSFTLEDNGMQVATPGSLVFGKMSNVSGVFLQSLLPTASVLGRAPSIRRPCNIRR
jgi:hypothetical protein